MPSTFSPNKDYELQATGENNGTWGIKTNSNLSTIDLNFGGRLPIDVAGSSNVVVSIFQAENVYHNITGILTGDIEYQLPAVGSFYFLKNGTTGAHTLTATCFGGTGVLIPQGSTVGVFVNPDTLTATSIINYIPGTTNVFVGGTTGGTANAQTLTVTTPGFTLTAGNMVIGIAGASTSGAATLSVNGTTAKNWYKATRSGVAAISANDVRNGQMTCSIYDGTQYILLNPALGTAAFVDTGTSANNILKLDGSAKIPAVDGSQLTGLTNTQISGLGTAATLNVGVSANNVVQLDGSAKLPAVDGSQLTNLSQASGSIAAWVNFNGVGALSVRDSLNVSSVTDNGVGDYTVNFSITFANSNYIYLDNGQNGGSDRYYSGQIAADSSGVYYSKTTTTIRLLSQAGGNGAQIDMTDINLAFIGDV